MLGPPSLSVALKALSVSCVQLVPNRVEKGDRNVLIWTATAIEEMYSWIEGVHPSMMAVEGPKKCWALF